MCRTIDKVSASDHRVQALNPNRSWTRQKGTRSKFRYRTVLTKDHKLRTNDNCMMICGPMTTTHSSASPRASGKRFGCWGLGFPRAGRGQKGRRGAVSHVAVHHRALLAQTGVGEGSTSPPPPHHACERDARGGWGGCVARRRFRAPLRR